MRKFIWTFVLFVTAISVPCFANVDAAPHMASFYTSSTISAPDDSDLETIQRLADTNLVQTLENKLSKETTHPELSRIFPENDFRPLYGTLESSELFVTKKLDSFSGKKINESAPGLVSIYKGWSATQFKRLEELESTLPDSVVDGLKYARRIFGDRKTVLLQQRIRAEQYYDAQSKQWLRFPKDTIITKYSFLSVGTYWDAELQRIRRSDFVNFSPYTKRVFFNDGFSAGGEALDSQTKVFPTTVIQTVPDNDVPAIRKRIAHLLLSGKKDSVQILINKAEEYSRANLTHEYTNHGYIIDKFPFSPYELVAIRFLTDDLTHLENVVESGLESINTCSINYDGDELCTLMEAFLEKKINAENLEKSLENLSKGDSLFADFVAQLLRYNSDQTYLRKMPYFVENVALLENEKQRKFISRFYLPPKTKIKEREANITFGGGAVLPPLFAGEGKTVDVGYEVNGAVQIVLRHHITLEMALFFTKSGYENVQWKDTTSEAFVSSESFDVSVGYQWLRDDNVTISFYGTTGLGMGEMQRGNDTLSNFFVVFGAGATLDFFPKKLTDEDKDNAIKMHGPMDRFTMYNWGLRLRLGLRTLRLADFKEPELTLAPYIGLELLIRELVISHQ